MSAPIKVLHLEDNPHDADLIARRLEAEGCTYAIVHVNTRQGFEAALESEPFELIMCDYNMPDYDGLQAIRRVRETQAETPVVILSGTMGDEAAVECLKAGATDYVLKHNLPRLVSVMARAVKERRERQERRDSQRELQMMSDRLELATKAAKIGIWDWDVSQDILHWDQTMHSLYSTKPGVFEGNVDAWQSRIHPDDQVRAVAELHAALRGEKDFTTEFRLLLPDKTLRWIQADAAILRDLSGQAIRMLGTNWDITEKKQAEELRIAKNAAEAANRAKSEFLATMSHELRTPLNGIIGMNELLGQTSLTDQQRMYVEACSASGKLLMQLINDILDLSKIEAGKMEITPRECDIEALVHDVADMLLPTAQQKGIELRCALDPAACVSALCDEHRLRQILINLVGNAIKFTPNGNVSIACEITAAIVNSPRLRISVTDTGIGIPQERHDRLFRPFSQVDSSTSRQFAGTGLGLSICRQLVELMGGEISVKSQVGVGSCFWFEIPIRILRQSMQRENSQQVLALTKILVVEGREHRRNQLANCLQSWGCSLALVDSCAAALDAARLGAKAGAPFKISMVDCRLAARNEYGALQKLAAIPDLHVIGLGAPRDEHTSSFLRSLGVRHLLGDLARPSEIFNALSSVLSVSSACDAGGAPHAISVAETAKPLSGHLLVAEDNRINQMYVTELLKSIGCTCDVASNGDEAVQAVRKNDYDLVLMDCQMPEMDGFTATREIRRWETGESRVQRLAIIALTANALSGDRDRCLEAGMDDYLSKPIERSRLCDLLAKYLKPIAADEGLAGAVWTGHQQIDRDHGGVLLILSEEAPPK